MFYIILILALIGGIIEYWYIVIPLIIYLMKDEIKNFIDKIVAKTKHKKALAIKEINKKNVIEDADNNTEKIKLEIKGKETKQAITNNDTQKAELEQKIKEVKQTENQEDVSNREEFKERTKTMEVDEYFEDAGRFVIEEGRAAAGQLQRRFSIGPNRAVRIIGQLHKAGVVGAADGTAPRKVLMSLEEFSELLSNGTIVIKDNEELINKKESENEMLLPQNRVDMYNNQYDYMTGEDFEAFIAQILRKIGYLNVYITPKSGDQGVDILAEKDNIKYAFQCKRYSSNIGNHAIQEVFSGKVIYDADIAVVITNSYFTKQAKQDAESLNVLLWDRDKLQNLINYTMNQEDNYIIGNDEHIKNTEGEKDGDTYSKYVEPFIGLLAINKEKQISDEELRETAIKIQDILKNFGVNVTMEQVTAGGRFTRYEIKPELGARISQITNLIDDIKLNLMVENIHVEKSIHDKNTIGIDIEQKDAFIVGLREMLETENFQEYPSDLAFAVGRDIIGNVIIEDISQMPHLLIAGTTGSGKTMCINSIIMSIVYKAKPDDVKMIMIDTKGVSLNIYNGLPHLFTPVIVNATKSIQILKWCILEIENRYKILADCKVQNIQEYNDTAKSLYKMPRILIIIDDLSDLMTLYKNDIEQLIIRIAQLSRKVGLHLVLSTQRPSSNVVTGLIKSNIPSRIAFSVFSSIDSRVIIDEKGAEELLGNGDMLFKSVNYKKPTRIQGTFVSDKEIINVVEFLKNNNQHH